MSKCSFEYFKVADPLDNVQAIADELVLLGNETERYSHIILDTYEEAFYGSYDLTEIVSLLEEVTYDNAKIVISGKDILSSDIFDPETAQSEVVKEQYMKTKYQKFPKPLL